MKKILMLSTGESTFVKHDYDILSDKYKTQLVYFNNIIDIVKSLNDISNNDIIYCRFADYRYFIHVAIAKYFNKKIVTTVGGYDVAKIDKYKYGIYTHPIKSILGKYVLESSDIICPIDQGLIEDIKQITSKKIKTKTIPIMIDKNYIKLFKKISNKDNKIITMVASTKKKPRYYIKGIDYFIELSKIMPNYTFLLIGTTLPNEYINIITFNKLDFKTISYMLSKSKYYVQLSRREGCPHALAEALLSECISFGWNVQGVRSVLDEKYLVPEGDIQELKNKIISTTKIDKKQIFEVNKKYNKTKRKKLLEGVMNGV